MRVTMTRSGRGGTEPALFLCFGLILHGADFGGKPRRGEDLMCVASNPEHMQRTATHCSAQQFTAHSSTVQGTFANPQGLVH